MHAIQPNQCYVMTYENNMGLILLQIGQWLFGDHDRTRYDEHSPDAKKVGFAVKWREWNFEAVGEDQCG